MADLIDKMIFDDSDSENSDKPAEKNIFKTPVPQEEVLSGDSEEAEDPF